MSYNNKSPDGDILKGVVFIIVWAVVIIVWVYLKEIL
mgnify:CR=1 FL=1